MSSSVPRLPRYEPPPNNFTRRQRWFCDYAEWALRVLRDRHIKPDEGHWFLNWTSLDDSITALMSKQVKNKGASPLPLAFPGTEEAERTFVSAVDAFRIRHAKSGEQTSPWMLHPESTPMTRFLFFESHCQWALQILKDRHLHFEEWERFDAAWPGLDKERIESGFHAVAVDIGEGKPVPLVLPNAEEIEQAFMDLVRAWRVRENIHPYMNISVLCPQLWHDGLHMHVQETQTVTSLKWDLQRTIGQDTRQMKLFYAGEELDGSRTLAGHKIAEHARILLTVLPSKARA